MNRPRLYTVAALAFGIAAVLVPDRIFPPDDNYRTLSVVGEAFRGVVLGSFRFAMGAFAGLGLAAGLGSIGGRGARRPVALVFAALLALVLVAFSGFALRGVTHFPAGGTLEERHRWAELRLERPYMEAVAWAAVAPALREACGESLRFGPAAGGRNVVRAGTEEWASTFTLDIEGELASARLVLTTRLPFSPKDARPIVGEAILEAGGRSQALDPAGYPVAR